MSRLTKPGYKFNLLNVMQGLNTHAEVDEVLNRLAAYEDTGLEPEKIAFMREHSNVEHNPRTFGTITYDAYKEALEILDAKKDGRCVVLPCKLGDAVWYIADGKVESAELKAIRINVSAEMNGVLFEGIIQHGAYIYCWVIGQMLYLTRAEAEAALAKEGEAL